MRNVLLLGLVLAGCSKDSSPAAPPPAPGVKVQLPRARSGAEIEAVAHVTIAIDGRVFVDGLAMENDEVFTAKLRELREQTPSIAVQLVADPGVTYAKIITTLDAVRQAGLVDVSFNSPQAPK